ncbi:BrnA antitoxin family protein [Rhodopila sp.]|uniref:BrnA antitoxin family protein n=1 Tax=Rhodopila sp. TaxID=2480087 RepID=UPI003D0E288B
MRQGGRPRIASPKVHIGLRLAADVVNGIRASGKGYNARVEKVLREALAKGVF